MSPGRVMAMPECTMPETFDPSSRSRAVTTVLDQSQDGHIDQLQRAAIGPVGADYYRPILSRFETFDRGSPSWNWAASLCTLNWMAFRGMWMPALAYLGGLMLAMAALFVVTRLAAPMPSSVEWGLGAALATLTFLVPGFFGNIWLFGHYRLRMARALSATPTVTDACQLLGQQASSRRRLVLLVAANVVLALLVAAVWVWPSTPRRESARVDQGEVRVSALPPVTPASQPAPAAVETSATALPAPDPSSNTPAVVEAGIRHAAMTARSRKAHRERPARVAANTSPTAQTAAPSALPAPVVTAAVPTASVGRYQINVGLFAQDANARRAFERLRAAGLPATTQALQRGNSTLTRLRVGPFASRAQADAAAQEIRALQLDAVVIGP